MDAALTLEELIAAAKRLSPAQQRELLRAINDDVERDEPAADAGSRGIAGTAQAKGVRDFVAMMGKGHSLQPGIAEDKSIFWATYRPEEE